MHHTSAADHMITRRSSDVVCTASIGDAVFAFGNPRFSRHPNTSTSHPPVCYCRTRDGSGGGRGASDRSRDRQAGCHPADSKRGWWCRCRRGGGRHTGCSRRQREARCVGVSERGCTEQPGTAWVRGRTRPSGLSAMPPTPRATHRPHAAQHSALQRRPVQHQQLAAQHCIRHVSSRSSRRCRRRAGGPGHQGTDQGDAAARPRCCAGHTRARGLPAIAAPAAVPHGWPEAATAAAAVHGHARPVEHAPR